METSRLGKVLQCKYNFQIFSALPESFMTHSDSAISRSAKFADGNLFTSNIAHSVGSGMYAGTGQNSQSSFYCYQDAGSVSYPLSNGATCTSVYVCVHSAPGIQVTILSNENYVELVNLGNVNPADVSTTLGPDGEQHPATPQVLTLDMAALSPSLATVASHGRRRTAWRLRFATLSVLKTELPTIGLQPKLSVLSISGSLRAQFVSRRRNKPFTIQASRKQSKL